MKTVLILAAFLAAALILCGYTNIRLPVRRREGKTHIACVGDSITYGCTLPLFFLRRYPAVLQRLMGEGVQVAAFGVNDRTLQNTGNKPFRKEKAFLQSKEYRPDAVVILRGTNDSQDGNWISADASRKSRKRSGQRPRRNTRNSSTSLPRRQAAGNCSARTGCTRTRRGPQRLRMKSGRR